MKPNHHELKIDPTPFADLLSGAKTCEVRNDDRGFQVGDTLRLHEREDDDFTGRVLERVISHIQRGYGLPSGICVLSYAPAEVAQGEAVDVVAHMWQHDETGRIGFVDQQQVDWGFEKNNPRLHLCGPLMTVAQHNRIVSALTAPPSPDADHSEHNLNMVDAELVALLRDVKACRKLTSVPLKIAFMKQRNLDSLSAATEWIGSVYARIDAKLASLNPRT